MRRNEACYLNVTLIVRDGVEGKPEVNMSQQGRGTGGIQVSVHNGWLAALLSAVSKCFHINQPRQMN